jgi:hypothetical protein
MFRVADLLSPSKRWRRDNRATRCIEGRMDIEVYTDRYQREHGHKPQGRRFWRFTLVSSSVTVRDHFLDLGEQMTYSQALAMAQEVARLRGSERIIVEP